MVMKASVAEAVPGPRMIHLNKRLLITRSGHETPKNATEYAITITKAPTTALITVATLQNKYGWAAAIPEPNSKQGYEPTAGAVAPAIRYNMRRRPERVSMRL